MEKLKKKVFWVIFLILSIFVISILCIFNYQSYNQEKKGIESNLSRMKDGKDDMEKEIQEPPIFMDTIAYTAIYNSKNEIIDVINHSQDEISDDEISEIAQKALNKYNAQKDIIIGNLYWNKYSYSFKGYNSITIIDNTTVQTKLISLLKTSIAMFILLEIINVIVSLKISSWIIKPVEESFNKQKQFITDASHELKTPIAVIMANAEALENEPNEEKWLNNIRSESERMNELITDLLDLAKLESGTSAEKYNTENLSKIIEKTILTFESLIYENNINLDYKIDENINLKCNGNQIKQLMAILLDNAIQHSDKNGEIKVTLEKEKNDIILKVSNKGEEIPKELQAKIFERFYRVDESRNRNSNRYGLGLAIAKNIVINHNGKISVQSANHYTTFAVRIKQV